jgi:two-component system cell cycle sensor histidine kinase/response regulator CckA
MQNQLEHQIKILKHGDHVCPIHDNATEQMDVAVMFIKEGLKCGDRNIYVADSDTVDSVTKEFTIAGINVEKECARGALRLLTKQDAYLLLEKFDPKKIIGFIQKLETEALKDGFSGLRYIGEMTWIQGANIDPKLLIEYETLLNQYVDGSRSTIFCQYQRSHFDSALIHDIVRIHPILILGELVCPNPYYEPPKLMLKPEEMGEVEFKRQRLDWWMKRLAEVNKKELMHLSNQDELRENAGRLRNILDSMFALVGLFSKDGIILDINRAPLETSGLKREEVIGKEFSGLDWWSHSPETQEQVKSALRSAALGETIRADFLLHAVKGRMMVMDTAFGPLRDAAGHVTEVVVSAVDVTARKEAEESLRKNAALLVIAARTARIGGWSVRLPGFHVTWSDEVCAIHEAPPGSTPTLEQGIAYYAPEYREIISNHFHACATDGTAFDLEVQIITGRGNKLWVRVIGQAERNEAGIILLVQGAFQDINDRRKAEESHRESELRFRQVVENIREVFWITDAERKQMLYISPGYEEIWGRPCESLYASPKDWVDAIIPEDRERITKAFLKQKIAGGYDEEYTIIRPDGSVRKIHDRGFPVKNASGIVYRLTGVAEDITEGKKLENQLHQSQKMEAIGQLAGGVAHDFNNLLTVINGYSDLLIASLSNDEKAQNYLGLIKEAGEQSAALTSQLLAFGRNQFVAPKVIDLNEVVRKVEKMLVRIIGEDIELSTALHPALGRVMADPGQIEQILLNLSVNGRDAMPKGGKLTIETANITLDENYTRSHAGVQPGDYVMLAVTDMGTGMTEEIKRHIFEPFFTTKDVGQGTGLGLSVVHGAVKQSNGNIEVYSEPGCGTAFKIYLPKADDSLTLSEVIIKDITVPKKGTETILLVEDEAKVREFARHVLQEYGFTILVAGNAKDALRISTEYKGKIDLLLTDVVMPETGGRVLAEQLQPMHPGMKVLFMSGYTADGVVRHGILHEHVNFLQKPFSPLALAKKVREVLG